MKRAFRLAVASFGRVNGNRSFLFLMPDPFVKIKQEGIFTVHRDRDLLVVLHGNEGGLSFLVALDEMAI